MLRLRNSNTLGLIFRFATSVQVQSHVSSHVAELSFRGDVGFVYGRILQKLELRNVVNGLVLYAG